jgi:hypothetical protein
MVWCMRVGRASPMRLLQRQSCIFLSRLCIPKQRVLSNLSLVYLQCPAQDCSLAMPGRASQAGVWVLWAGHDSGWPSHGLCLLLNIIKCLTFQKKIFGLQSLLSQPPVLSILETPPGWARRQAAWSGEESWGRRGRQRGYSARGRGWALRHLELREGADTKFLSAPC